MITRMENLYYILNCEENFTAKQLRKSYQELALKYHPDKSKDGDGSAEKFIKINHAWTILSDPWLREQYDVKWKERCLAQTFPIQDTLDLDEFDIVESTKSGVGMTECDVEKTQCDVETSQHNGEKTECDVEKTQCDVEKSQHNGEKTECDVETELSRTSIQSNTSTLSEEISNDDATYYIYPCRCGGCYTLTSVDVKLKFDIVCCDTCSLSVKVVYTEDNDS